MQHVIRFARVHELDQLVEVDDDACALFEQAGIALKLAPDSAFVVAEQLAWRRALEAQRVFVAVDRQNRIQGFAALDLLDGVAYLDQLSVRGSAMQRAL